MSTNFELYISKTNLMLYDHGCNATSKRNYMKILLTILPLISSFITTVHVLQ